MSAEPQVDLFDRLDGSLDETIPLSEAVELYQSVSDLTAADIRAALSSGAELVSSGYVYRLHKS